MSPTGPGAKPKKEKEKMDKRKNCVFGKGFASLQALGAYLFRACWPRAQRWPDFSKARGKGKQLLDSHPALHSTSSGDQTKEHGP